MKLKSTVSGCCFSHSTDILCTNQTVQHTWCVCSSQRAVLPTRQHPAGLVPVFIIRFREIQAMWPQNFDTDILHRNAVQGVYNATCHASNPDTAQLSLIHI